MSVVKAIFCSKVTYVKKAQFIKFYCLVQAEFIQKAVMPVEVDDILVHVCRTVIVANRAVDENYNTIINGISNSTPLKQLQK